MRKSVGPLWLETCDWGAAPAPLASKGVGQEEDFPWRTGPCLILRLPFSSRACAVGRWTEEQPHETDEDGPHISFRQLDLEEVFRVRKAED